MKDLSSLSLQSAFTDLWHIGDDIRMSHYIRCDLDFPTQFSLKDFLIIYLKRGTLNGKMNGRETSYSAPCMITLPSAAVYEFTSASEDVDAIAMSFSSTFNTRLNLLNRFQLIDMFNKEPGMPLDEQMVDMFEVFISKLVELGKHPENPYLEDAITHLVLYFFYGMGYCYYQTHQSANRSNQIVDEFIELVNQYGFAKRNINFYAEKLRLSPKYVQGLVKKVTGRPAYSWIEDALLNESKKLLSENKMTIQQIADRLCFCDQSYFGAYFKRMTGTTPKAYRNKMHAYYKSLEGNKPY